MLQGAPDYFDAAFPEGVKDKLLRWVVDTPLPPYLRLRQRLAPAYYCWILKCWIVLGFDAVQEVFTRWEDAPVANHYKTSALGWDPPFLLALNDKNAAFDKLHEQVRTYWSTNRIAGLRQIARSVFESLLRNAEDGTRRIDAIGDYMIPGFLDIVDQYYGVRFADPQEESDFVHALFVISSFFFGKAKGDAKVRPHAQRAFVEAMRSLQRVIDAANADRANARGVLGDLVAARTSNADTKSWLLGMILGFIPTSTNAQGRVLDLLLRRPEAMEWACQTVDGVGSADRRFLAVCHEALRLNYILPGLFREAREGFVLGEDTDQPVAIEAGEIMLVSNQTAMFDPRRFAKPTAFNADRAYLKYLNYGHRMHFCVGWDISDIVMEETFRALVHANVRRPRRAQTEWRGGFPWVREVEVTITGAQAEAPA